jgi:hypothetical protein
MRGKIAALALLSILIACDSHPPTGPEPPRPDDPPTPPPTDPVMVSAVTIAGNGRFTAAGEVHRFTATAQMNDGTSLGVSAKATWSSSDTSVVSVSAEGQVTSVGVGLATITAFYNSAGRLDVTVAPSDGSQIAGLYRLFLTAASTCRNLPTWAQHREYDATIDQPADTGERGAALILTVRIEPGYAPRFPGGIRGSRVSFWFPTDEPYSYGDGDPIFVERIDDNKQFSFTGQAEGRKDASRNIEIAGVLLYGPIRAINSITHATIAECRSSRNQFRLVRQ